MLDLAVDYIKDLQKQVKVRASQGTPVSSSKTQIQMMRSMNTTAAGRPVAVGSLLVSLQGQPVTSKSRRLIDLILPGG